MKKGLMFLLGIVSFLGINTVSADEIYLEYDTNVNQVKPYIDEIGYDKINDSINKLINYYNNNLFSEYPKYIISLKELNEKIHIVLTAFDDSGIEDYFFRYFDQTIDSSYLLVHYTYSARTIQFEYNFESNDISSLGINSGFSSLSLFDIDSDIHSYNVYNYYYSNFDLYYRGDLLTDETDESFTYVKYDDTLYFPYLNDSSKYSVHKANSKFLIEPYYLYDDNESLKEEIYTTIDLNQYSYVALSLKDYDTIPENTYSTYTNLYVKGQLCATPVYNYGMTERKDILTGTQVQRCSSYYNDFTTTRMYILPVDVENHAIYYLKAYDTSKENIVKIDSTVFDVSYITEENKDTPYVNILGKQYPTLSYDSLTDTATKSEDEDYISGVTCPVGDFNCYNKYNNDNIFQEIFDKPLEILKSIFTAVKSVFTIITEFISLLPEAMQGFLYLSFTIAIILGIIKIIL